MTVDELRSLLLMLGFRPRQIDPELLCLSIGDNARFSVSLGEPVGQRNNQFRVLIHYGDYGPRPFIFRNTPEKRHEAFLFITTRLEEFKHE